MFEACLVELYIKMCICIAVIAFALYLLHKIYIWAKNEKLRNIISSRKFIYYKDFEKNWIVSSSEKRGKIGYKYNDTSGCYVITIYDYYVDDGKFMDYDDIYIGQSVNVCQRVHNHFNGKGNGDVYADIKYGRYVYVQIIPCRKDEMNVLEKQLIRAFKATKSYNSTKGGGKKR